MAISYSAPLPNDMYRDLAQAFIDEEWDNGAAKTPENGGAVLEQNGIGSAQYTEIEAWVKPTVADVTSGQKDGRDFLKLVFKDINHQSYRGLYYQFENNYWIVNDYNHFTDLAQDVNIRRCNNELKIKDEYGVVYTFPCVIDYDMSSPSNQISHYIITPNNHAVVIVQANEDSRAVLTLNKRFIIGGRPFKIQGFQNALHYSNSDQEPTILYIDMYLDEFHDKDDLVNGIADNGENVWTISLSGSARFDDYTTLYVNVLQNGETPVVPFELEWSSSNDDVAHIAYENETNIVISAQSSGGEATITCVLKQNRNVSASMDVMVTGNFESQIILSQDISTVRQFATVEFEVDCVQGGSRLDMPADSIIELRGADGAQLTATKIKDLGYKCSLRGRKLGTCQLFVSCVVSFYGEPQTVTKTIDIQVVSMMG